MFFKKFLDESSLKPNKIWVDKGIEFYNRSKKPLLEKNDIEMHSIHNEGKFLLQKNLLET